MKNEYTKSLESFKREIIFVNQFKMFSSNFWFQNANRPSTSEAARKESQSQEKDGKRHHDDGSGSSQCCRSAHASSSPVTKKKIMQTPSGKQ